ncbi:MAG: methyltransferase domain-containing protein [Elusimicrobia bacterium]|nr:methyltransferase domain-containing protein [Elusimicrobiota bacterium]
MKDNPIDFKLECSTVWSFPKRGNWVTHSSSFRGNWAPQMPRNIILRYSKESDTVLDQMVGSGTTAIECKLLKRNFIGIDINPKMIGLTKKAVDFKSQHDIKTILNVGDAKNLNSIKDESVDLIATHPPYADIIKYSNGKIEGDLSNIHDIDEFCNEMEKVAKECFRVVKPKKYCAILIGDTRRKKYYVSLAYRVMQEFLNVGFKLREDIIKHQWNCKTTPFWAKKSQEYNFLLIMHEHLFVFEK